MYSNVTYFFNCKLFHERLQERGGQKFLSEFEEMKQIFVKKFLDPKNIEKAIIVRKYLLLKIPNLKTKKMKNLLTQNFNFKKNG